MFLTISYTYLLFLLIFLFLTDSINLSEVENVDLILYKESLPIKFIISLSLKQ